MTILLFVFVLAVIASFIQRVSGFGFGIFVMMFFPFLLPSYGESVMLSGLLSGTTALLIVIRNWKYVRWSKMWLVVLFNVFVSFLVTQYMVSLGNDTLKACLGVVLILIALYFLFGEGKLGKLFSSRPAQMTIGSISGLMGGMFAMPGPPVVLYCISIFNNKYEYLTTLQAFSVTFNVFYAVFRLQAGFCSEDMAGWWLVGMIGGLIGTWIGSRYFEFISNRKLKNIVYTMMIVSGIVAIYSVC